MVKEFISQEKILSKNSFNCKWEAPSNIALIKYWGKSPVQIPMNPSISFTLKNCVTKTDISFEPIKNTSKKVKFEFSYNGESKSDFNSKLEIFFERIINYQPFLIDYYLKINSVNNFPHSSGIASSASAMAALSACLIDFENSHNPIVKKHKKTSFLSRLGSGSACRSVSGPIMTWGKHSKIPKSNDFYATKFLGYHQIFDTYCDSILLVDSGKKEVSSTLGHELMKKHPFASSRFKQAKNNFSLLSVALKSGDLDSFIKIVENEALQLHAMMMTSNPYFILIKPKTLNIINEIRDFRRKFNIPICFTLDAGANVHLLYPQIHKSDVLELIKKNLSIYCNNSYINDEVGVGIKKIKFVL